MLRRAWPLLADSPMAIITAAVRRYNPFHAHHPHSSNMVSPTPLKRVLGTTRITLYGIGTIIGAGIYVLLGEVVAASGSFSALSFLFAAVIVSFSAYSYAHLSRQFPVSAGEAVYVQEAFKLPALSSTVGWLIVFAGTVSAATIANGFTGYFRLFAHWPDALIILLLVSLLTSIAAWGVSISVSVAVGTALLEFFGLILVIYAGGEKIPTLLDDPSIYLLPNSASAWAGIGTGAFIAFYAFIGFEDMVNMAEEVKDPERALPRGIFIALTVSTVLYILVALTALAALPVDELSGAEAPLAMIIERNTNIPIWIIGSIGMIAVVNGALLQIIMASRMLYGMGKRGLAPTILSSVHDGTRTPLLATLLIGLLVLVFALALPINTLAQLTSGLILLVFTLVNLALFVINQRAGTPGLWPRLIPLTGTFLCASFVALHLLT